VGVPWPIKKALFYHMDAAAAAAQPFAEALRSSCFRPTAAV